MSLLTRLNVPGGFVAHSESWGQIFRKVELLAPVDTPVVITGETGTGKYLLAQFIHQVSKRRGNFFKISCTNVVDCLFDSEIFGSIKGAFTGATSKNGLIHNGADGTTLFDEVTYLSVDNQGKLLGLLDEGTFTPVGARVPSKTNTRIVATTNQDWEGLADSQRFRSDLYYRLDWARIHIPPLRERPNDVLPLIEHFLHCSKQNPQHGIVFKRDIEAARKLTEYNWPGNIRQVRNTVEKALLEMKPDQVELSASAVWEHVGRPQSRPVSVNERDYRIDNALLSPSSAPNVSANVFQARTYGEFDQKVKEAEIAMIEQALKASLWNRKTAAGLLGIEYKALLYNMKKFGLDRKLQSDQQAAGL